MPSQQQTRNPQQATQCSSRYVPAQCPTVLACNIIAHILLWLHKFHSCICIWSAPAHDGVGLIESVIHLNHPRCQHFSPCVCVFSPIHSVQLQCAAQSHAHCSITNLPPFVSSSRFRCDIFPGRFRHASSHQHCAVVSQARRCVDRRRTRSRGAVCALL
jgi:hypothetical protein